MPVPHLFHFIWVDGSPPLPELFREFTKTWTELNPGWEAVWWSDVPKELGGLVNQNIWDRAADICPKAVGQLRSDLARYEILLRQGGVYVDVDFECLKSIEPLIEDIDCFCAWEIQGRVANNAILGATPGHPFLKSLVDDLPERVRTHPKRWPAQMTGPHYLTSRLTPTVKVFDQAMFYAVGCTELDRLTEPYGENEWARHYWNHQHEVKNRALPGETR